ncbi:MAG: 16S rRNA (cytosine(1402)-N(4))-methyltransferase RsmH [bacterium]|nr:16S rRNA (cytosine(1402)-N(4))-methyltransferase RsmH [bacterium]
MHKPVLVNEVLSFIKPSHKTILDATCGSGEHSKSILSKFPDVRLVCVDIDPYMIELAKNNVNGKNVEFYVMNFKDVYKLNIKFDFVLLDLGFSSIQIEIPEYGLSFNHDFPLTMSYERKPLLEEFLKRATPSELAEIFEKYGNMKNAYRVAIEIIKEFRSGNIKTTKDLSNVISKYSKSYRLHPATKYFMALRTYLNNELINLKAFIDSLRFILNENGLCAIISFNSNEDRVIKEGIKKNGFKLITKHVIKPTRSEVLLNPRSRSARMRVFG